MMVYGIFGDPVSHSLSPAMHNAAFRALGMDSCYIAFKVSLGSLESALCGAKAMGFGGLNITVPLKERAFILTSPDREAIAIGAVNTVAFEVGCEGKISSFNTDGIGAEMSLIEAGVGIRGAKVLIIGAGGSARAISYRLVRSGAKLDIVNRSRQRALDLAGFIGCEGHGWEELEGLVSDADVIINATTVGMNEEDSRLIDPALLRSEQIVFDIIYNRQTKLLKDAAAAGCTTLDGVMMLVHQGAASFEIWTGRRAPSGVMERAVRDALERREQR